MANALTARWAALGFLDNILQHHLPLDQAFEQTCRHFGDRLTPQDRGFARHLGTTCLRHLGQLDTMINHCTPKKLTSKQTVVRNILRLGITQLLYMAVPAHAAVDSAVRMTDKQKNSSDRHAKGMVNAVLRRIDREREKFSTKFSPEQNIPAWLRTSWQQRFGAEAVARIADGLQAEPPLDITLKPGEDGAEWAQKLGGILLPNGSVRLEKAGAIPRLAGYDDGLWWVQDVAASLPAMLMGAGPGDRVLELCAAPGGKTAQAAARGSRVTAVDQSARRIRRLEENMTRLGLACEVVTADAAAYVPDCKFPYILLDAPCSSTGTLRRHPDVSRTRGPRDIQSLADIQTRLLAAAADMLEAGGELIYCVCSLQAEEGPDRIRALLAGEASLKRKPVTAAELPGFAAALTEDGDVQTLPFHAPGEGIAGGMDGFFISRLVRQA